MMRGEAEPNPAPINGTRLEFDEVEPRHEDLVVEFDPEDEEASEREEGSGLLDLRALAEAYERERERSRRRDRFGESLAIPSVGQEVLQPRAEPAPPAGLPYGWVAALVGSASLVGAALALIVAHVVSVGPAQVISNAAASSPARSVAPAQSEEQSRQDADEGDEDARPRLGAHLPSWP